MILRIIAALYIDPRGPYPKLPGVDAWDETRDARGYPGPGPVIVHPPCGPWGLLAEFCRLQDSTLAPLAVGQVRGFGGKTPLAFAEWLVAIARTADLSRPFRREPRQIGLFGEGLAAQ